MSEPEDVLLDAQAVPTPLRTARFDGFDQHFTAVNALVCPEDVRIEYQCGRSRQIRTVTRVHWENLRHAESLRRAEGQTECGDYYGARETVRHVRRLLERP